MSSISVTFRIVTSKVGDLIDTKKLTSISNPIKYELFSELT